MLSFLPDFFVHLILVLGVLGTILGFVLGFIPFVGKYKLPIQIISILLLSFGLYLEGGLANEEKWQLKVKEMEAKVAEAQAKSAKVNTEIVTKVITKDKIIREKGDEIVKIIEKEVIKIDQTCPKVPDIAVKLHNAAALNDTNGLNKLLTESKNTEKKESTPVVKEPEKKESTDTSKPPLILPKK